MTDFEITKIAMEEIERKAWGVTEQFLQIHELIYEQGKPKILRIDKDEPDGTAIVYFPVKDEKFYFAVYVETAPIIKIRWIGTEPMHSVSFRATSENLNFEQLASLTTLKPTGGWDKGQAKKHGNSVYKFSSIEFLPNPEPDAFDDKIRKLLDFLEGDVEGIRRLAKIGGGQIQVASIFHNGNTMLGGFHLDQELLKRLYSLEVEIDFDLYAEGRKFTG
jgi:hypothetical protein